MKRKHYAANESERFIWAFDTEEERNGFVAQSTSGFVQCSEAKAKRLAKGDEYGDGRCTVRAGSF